MWVTEKFNDDIKDEIVVYSLSVCGCNRTFELLAIQVINIRLEYIMLLNLPIILSSNSFLFYLLFPFFFLIYSPAGSK